MSFEKSEFEKKKEEVEKSSDGAVLNVMDEKKHSLANFLGKGLIWETHEMYAEKKNITVVYPFVDSFTSFD
ncbi:unnamed protein product [Sphenostylis stenocarpa]|uniref:Uncharacterized protein n=1 Tax=Sphenostylis stenocarpa TaxID=92480 RepID=A0AA86VF39_9FABA|nr:unnamed protein product [Sphenostylis stenocarpa]